MCTPPPGRVSWLAYGDHLDCRASSSCSARDRCSLPRRTRRHADGEEHEQARRRRHHFVRICEIVKACSSLLYCHRENRNHIPVWGNLNLASRIFRFPITIKISEIRLEVVHTITLVFTQLFSASITISSAIPTSQRCASARS